MASVREIARRAGVSITTVSRVLNNHPLVSPEVREKVLAAVNEARYVAPVGRRSTDNIALFYTGEPSLGSPFDAALMQGMSGQLEQFGYDLMILSNRRTKRPHETYTQMFMRKGVRAAVLRTTDQTRRICQAIAEEGFPAVLVGDRLDHPRLSYIYSDSRHTSREAVEHLIGLGHRRIAICINVVDDSDHLDRLAGYREALEQHGLEVDARLIMRVRAQRDGGVQLIRRLVSMSDPPTAVFLTDPMVAVGALSEARKVGLKIPEQLSIVGFDDAELRYSVSPEMTAVCQDAVAMGQQAIAILHNMLQRPGPNVYVHKALPTWFEIHASTAAAPSSTVRSSGG